MHRSVADSQTDHNSIGKNVYCLKLTLLQSFYFLKWNILLTGIVYLIIDTKVRYTILKLPCWHILFQCVNELIYYLFAYVISFYQLSYCFLMCFKICKEYREY